MLFFDIIYQYKLIRVSDMLDDTDELNAFADKLAKHLSTIKENGVSEFEVLQYEKDKSFLVLTKILDNIV